jgi:hypothetical protein
MIEFFRYRSGLVDAHTQLLIFRQEFGNQSLQT